MKHKANLLLAVLGLVGVGGYLLVDGRDTELGRSETPAPQSSRGAASQIASSRSAEELVETAPQTEASQAFWRDYWERHDTEGNVLTRTDDWIPSAVVQQNCETVTQNLLKWRNKYLFAVREHQGV